MKKHNRIRLALAALLLVLLVGCGVYVSDYYRADRNAAAAMAGSETVCVEQMDDMVVFLPENAQTGFIFYPGGKVEYTAYAPLMMALAEQNVLCVLVEMPFNLAVLDTDAADGIPEQFPQIQSWFLGGHSLGGSMAAGFAAEHCEDLDGLVLLAAYSTADLRSADLRVASIYGSEDGVMNMEKYVSYRNNLPETIAETVIEGGNHAGFGSYGAQEGDGKGSISAEQQTHITAGLLLDFFANGQ